MTPPSTFDRRLLFTRAPSTGSEEQVELLLPDGERLGPQRLDLEPLLTRSKKALVAGLASDPDLGRALAEALGESILGELDRWLQDPSHDAHRLVLEFGANSVARALPWEALQIEPGRSAQVEGRLELVRHVPSRPIHAWPWLLVEQPRVLVLLGSHRQDPGVEKAENEAREAIAHLGAALEGKQTSLSFEVAGPAAFLQGRRGPLRMRQVTSLQDLMQLASRERYDAVCYLGHSDGVEPWDPLADTDQVRRTSGLRFSFPGEDFPKTLTAASGDPERPSLARFLRLCGARLLFVGGCLVHDPFARAVLSATDHLVATTTKVDPAHAARFLVEFLLALFPEASTTSGPRESSLALAASAARRALQSTDAWGALAQWSVTLADGLEPREGPRALRRYLDQLCAEHRKLHGPLAMGLRNANRALAATYVELGTATETLRDELGGRGGQEALDARAAWRSFLELGSCEEGELDLLGARGERGPTKPTLKRLLELGPEHGFTRRWVLLSGATEGKTTTLRSVARELAQEPLLRFVPAFLSFGRLLAQEIGSLERLIQTLPHLQDQASYAQSLASCGQFAVFVDSLDEVEERDGKRERALELLAALEADLAERGSSVLVVSSREHAWVEPALVGPDHEIERRRFLPISLLPLDYGERDELIGKWLEVLGGQKSAARRFPGLATAGKLDLTEARSALSALLAESASLRLAARNPFAIALLVRRFATHERQAQAPLALTRRALYHRFLWDLLRERHKRASRRSATDSPSKTALETLLTRLGRLCLDAARSGGTLIRIKAAKQALSREERRFLRQRGVLVPKDGQLGFSSQVLFDHLASEALVAKLREQRSMAPLDEILAGQRPAPTLGEVLVLITDALRPANQARWVRRLHDLDPVLGLRAALQARSLDEEMLGRLLGLGSYGETRDRLQQLGSQAQDPKAWLDLLERVLRSLPLHRSAALYALDEYLQAQAWPDELLPRAAGLLESRLRELPAPTLREEDFARIPTPREFRTEHGLRAIQEGLEEDWFWMGSPEIEEGRSSDETRHPVCLRDPYWMGRTTVTVEQFTEFDPEHECPGGGRHPVTWVSWHACQIFVRWLRAHGWEARLPSEAQWEWAARGGSATAYWSGPRKEDLERIGWYLGNANETRPVAQLEANPFGLHDVHGNVWEWIEDQYQGYPELDPDGHRAAATPEPGSRGRVLRGGSGWDDAVGCRSAARDFLGPDFAYVNVGFRLCMSAPPPSPPAIEDRS